MRPGGAREHRGVGDGIPTGRVDSPLAWAGGLEPAPDGAGGVRAVPRGSRGARTGWQRARRAAPLRGTAPGPPLRPSDGAGSAAGVRAGFRGAAAGEQRPPLPGGSGFCIQIWPGRAGGGERRGGGGCWFGCFFL